MLADSFPITDLTESAIFMEGDAGSIFWKGTRLQCPQAYFFRFGDEGAVVTWTIEMSNIQNTIRRGIRASTFDVGDVVTATVYPLENGGSGGSYLTITAADGTTYE